MRPGQRALFTTLVVLGVSASAGVLGVAVSQYDGRGSWALIALGLLVGVEALRVVQNVSLWGLAVRAHDPVPREAPIGLRVALITTFVPSREPIDLLASTLRAMTNVHYDGGTVDVWVLDEGDDSAVRELADSLGVRHFTRRHRPEFNQPTGPWRARTKHGNHNAWRAVHEHRYTVVAHLDPEHAPVPDFFERTLGYFHDPDVAFVVTPHVYANHSDGFVARAAAAHFYPFIGILQRGANRIGTPMLIGATHLYRTAAWARSAATRTRSPRTT